MEVVINTDHIQDAIMSMPDSVQMAMAGIAYFLIGSAVGWYMALDCAKGNVASGKIDDEYGLFTFLCSALWPLCLAFAVCYAWAYLVASGARKIEREAANKKKT